MAGKSFIPALIGVAGMALFITPSVSVTQSVTVNAPAPTATPALVTLDANNVPLATILESIARHAGLRLVLDPKRVSAARPVSLHARNMRAEDAFAYVLAGTGLVARIASGYAVLSASDPTATSSMQGSISGTVLDAQTRHPLRGATVTLAGTPMTATAGEQGIFRFNTVASGQYTMHVRSLGYVKVAKPVTVVEGQIVAVEIVLEPSVNALDQVIVTGTVVATAQREVPNAMTVITAKDLEQRGITKIDQLFRGDVPGVFAMNLGSNSPLDEVAMFSRGATALSNASAGTTLGITNSMKTYVDGVELADSRYLNQLDPKSIERIEIVTGPQASTIYGSNAINGVMQVFTKRGTTSRPQLTATLLSGWVENDFRPTRTPQHDHAAQVMGVEGHWAYNAGGSWNYMGPWTPGKQTSRVSGFGGARVQRHTPLGPVMADGSLRLATTQTRQEGSAIQASTAFREQGLYYPYIYNGLMTPTTQTLVGQTLGLSLGFAPMSWWTHEFVFGADRSASESRGRTPGFLATNDSLVTLTQSTVDRRSVRYASTVQVPVAHVARAVVTVGADGWQSLNTSLQVNALALTGTLTPSGTPKVTRQPGHNAGGFLQAQVGLWEQLFVTYGLRAEWNPTYGDEAQPNWAPRYGMSYTRDMETPFGLVTAKLRASYGRSTRPPAVGTKAPMTATAYLGASAANSLFIPYYGDYDYVRANPELTPEHQDGGEGGLELYLGRRGSLVVTRYNQTVEDLIARPGVDSVRSKDPNNTPSVKTSCDAAGYCYYTQLQNMNVGTIRNQGWELQGTVTTGPLTTRGTYSWTKSRTIGVNPKYRAFFNPSAYPQYQPGASFRYLPEHTWSGSVTYARARSMVAFNFSGIGMVVTGQNLRFVTSISPDIRLDANRMSLRTAINAAPNAGYVLADLNASQRFSPRVEGIVQVQNLGDVYRNDISALYATLGRQTKLGIRWRP